MPTVLAALSRAFAKITSLPQNEEVNKLAGVIDTRLLIIGIPYSAPKSSATLTIFSAFLQILS